MKLHNIGHLVVDHTPLRSQCLNLFVYPIEKPYAKFRFLFDSFNAAKNIWEWMRNAHNIWIIWGGYLEDWLMNRLQLCSRLYKFFGQRELIFCFSTAIRVAAAIVVAAAAVTFVNAAIVAAVKIAVVFVAAAVNVPSVNRLKTFITHCLLVWARGWLAHNSIVAVSGWCFS